MECQLVTVYNHKGGVGKTTMTYAMAWAMACCGYRVVMFDLDAQFSLNQSVLGRSVNLSGLSWEEYLEAPPATHSIVDALALAASSNVVQASDSVLVVEFPNGGSLRLCVGHDTLSVFEEDLARANTLVHVDGTDAPIAAPYQVIRQTCRQLNAQIAFLDLSPGFGALTKNILGFSHFLITPCLVDQFSFYALRNLVPKLRTEVLFLNEANPNDPLNGRSQRNTIRRVNQGRTAKRARLQSAGIAQSLIDADPSNELLPNPPLRYIGYGLSSFTNYRGVVAAFQVKMDQIVNAVHNVHLHLGQGKVLTGAMIARFPNVHAAYRLFEMPDQETGGQNAQLVSIPAPFMTNRAESRVSRTTTKKENLQVWRQNMNSCCEHLIAFTNLPPPSNDCRRQQPILAQPKQTAANPYINLDQLQLDLAVDIF